MGANVSKAVKEIKRKIVILGKTGAGKSSLANTIFGEDAFKINHSPNSETSECQAKTTSVSRRKTEITLIDTPGFFDTRKSEDELKPEIVRCITMCAPGPHAFLIVLKVEKFTEHEQDVINKVQEYFSEEAFKYATVVFTHGDQLPKGQTIEDHVSQNELVSDLVKKCGGRCFVIDNKYWNKKHEYRSNKFQVEELLKSIEKMVEEKKNKQKKDYYTNEMLEAVEKKIQQEEEHQRLLPGNKSEEEIREQAKHRVFEKLSTRLAGTATGALLGALFGVVVMVKLVVKLVKEINIPQAAKAAAAAGTAVAGEAAVWIVPAVVIGSAVVGAVKGGVEGYRAAEGADTPLEAAKRAAEAVTNEALAISDTLSQPNSKQF